MVHGAVRSECNWSSACHKPGHSSLVFVSYPFAFLALSDFAVRAGIGTDATYGGQLQCVLLSRRSVIFLKQSQAARRFG